MGNSFTHYCRRAAAFLAIAILSSLALAAKPFSAMSAEEVSALLSEATATASATDAANVEPSAEATLPVMLRATDMVQKVYGIVDPSAPRDECIRLTADRLRLVPQEDLGVLWLESDAGYRVNYNGMAPDVSAMARYDSPAEGVADYGYFFLFPYTDASHSDCIRRQADFCGTLLQEMHDAGLALDLATGSDSLFEAVGEYDGSFIDVRLLDDPAEAGSGRYILILSVEPGAATAAGL